MRRLMVMVVLAGALGCSSSDESSSSGGAGGHTAVNCTGTYTLLQKDAYRETAGRSSSLWPPHTTTTFEWTCDGSANTATSFMANHGTEPDATDANGDVFLVEVASRTVAGDSNRMLDLQNAYRACECGTSFLSMDALQDAAVQQLVSEITNYVTMYLTCSGSVDAQGLAMLLQQGDIDAVIAELPNCSWDAGEDWASGFDQALEAIIAAAQETLADYHVCNNDAALQTRLFDDYAASGNVPACDGADALCSGPMWFYDP